MRFAIAALMLGLATPVSAAGCAFYSSAGQSVAFSEDGNWITFDGGDGKPLTCPYEPVEFGWSPVDCGPWQGRLIIGSSRMGSGIGDLLVFQTEFFYWHCPEGA